MKKIDGRSIFGVVEKSTKINFEFRTGSVSRVLEGSGNSCTEIDGEIREKTRKDAARKETTPNGDFPDVSWMAGKWTTGNNWWFKTWAFLRNETFLFELT